MSECGTNILNKKYVSSPNLIKCQKSPHQKKCFFIIICIGRKECTYVGTTSNLAYVTKYIQGGSAENVNISRDDCL